jgi:hypothetical protein
VVTTRDGKPFSVGGFTERHDDIKATTEELPGAHARR